MGKKERYQSLLKLKRRLEDRLLQGLRMMGQGSWHEDSSYEFGDEEVRLCQSYLEDLEKEIKELERELWKPETLEELLKKKEAAEQKLAHIKRRLGIQTGSRYGDEFADQEFRVLSAYLEDIEKEIIELKKKIRGR